MKVSAEDDLGLPESPLYSNYSKYLWKSHAGRRAVLNTNGLKQKAELTVRPQADLLPAVIKLAPVTKEDIISKVAT